jgi:hypothetical protein
MTAPSYPPTTVPLPPQTFSPTASSKPTSSPTYSQHNITKETQTDQTALWVLSVVSVVLAVFTTYFLVQFFARKDTPLYARIIVGLSWFLGFFGILTLLPLDLVTELYQGDFSPIANLWKLTYWVTFLLAWVICAIAQEYHVDGHFTFRSKMISACIRTIKLYLKILVVLVVLGVILYFAVGINQQYLVAASNFYGLSLIVIMLGYGLVELPVSIWRAANAERMLASEFFRASTVETEMIDAEDFVDETVEEIVLFRNRLSRSGERNRDLEIHTDQVLELAPRRDATTRTTSSSSRVGGTSTTSSSSTAAATAAAVTGATPAETNDKLPLTMASLAKLHMNLKIALAAADRARWDWNHLLEKTTRLEKLIQYQNNPSANTVAPEDENNNETGEDGSNNGENNNQQQQVMEMSSNNDIGDLSTTSQTNGNDGNGGDINGVFGVVRGLDGGIATGTGTGAIAGDGGIGRVQHPSKCCLCCVQCGRAYRGFVFRHHTLAYRALAIVCGISSSLLLWSAISSPFSETLSVYGMILHLANNPITIWASSFLPLVYMVTTCYIALFKFNYFDALALHGNQQTDAYNLLYNASYMCRLEFSLGVVYANMLFPQDTRYTAFYKMVGDMDTRQFIGLSFNKWAPVLILFFAIASFFNLGNRALDCLGIGTHKLPRRGNPEHEEKIAEGMRLVSETRARRERERRRQFATSTAQYSVRTQLARATGREGSYARVEDLLENM